MCLIPVPINPSRCVPEPVESVKRQPRSPLSAYQRCSFLLIRKRKSKGNPQHNCLTIKRNPYIFLRKKGFLSDCTCYNTAWYDVQAGAVGKWTANLWSCSAGWRNRVAILKHKSHVGSHWSAPVVTNKAEPSERMLAS